MGPSYKEIGEKAHWGHGWTGQVVTILYRWVICFEWECSVSWHLCVRACACVWELVYVHQPGNWQYPELIQLSQMKDFNRQADWTGQTRHGMAYRWATMRSHYSLRREEEIVWQEPVGSCDWEGHNLPTEIMVPGREKSWDKYHKISLLCLPIVCCFSPWQDPTKSQSWGGDLVM